MKTKETEIIKIERNLDQVCPVCGKVVDINLPGTGWEITGHGKFRKKRYFHTSCYSWGSDHYDYY